MNPRIVRLAMAVGTVAAAAITTLLVVPQATASPEGRAQAELAAARAYTAALHDQDQASKAGWVNTGLPCFDNPGSGPNNGGMGYHWLRSDETLSNAPDASQPEILVFDPVTGKLAAVEYVVLQTAVPIAPSLFGRQFTEAVLPDGTRVWKLHAWLWEPNPNGMFADFNPQVSLCP